MSHRNNERAHGRDVDNRRPGGGWNVERRHANMPHDDEEEEEEGEELAETEAMDEVMEGNVQADKLMAALKGGSSADIAEKLVFMLESNPDSDEARTLVKFFIRKMYITSGGLPFNKESPIPYDLEPLNNQELTNILENMIIYTARTKQKNNAANLINALTNFAYCFGDPQNLQTINQIQSDDVLRSAMIEVFLGTHFGPALTLAISGASHVSNLLRNYYDGKRKPSSTDGGGARKPDTTPPSSTSGVSSNATNKPSV